MKFVGRHIFMGWKQKNKRKFRITEIAITIISVLIYVNSNHGGFYIVNLNNIIGGIIMFLQIRTTYQAQKISSKNLNTCDYVGRHISISQFKED